MVARPINIRGRTVNVTGIEAKVQSTSIHHCGLTICSLVVARSMVCVRIGRHMLGNGVFDILWSSLLCPVASAGPRK